MMTKNSLPLILVLIFLMTSALFACKKKSYNGVDVDESGASSKPNIVFIIVDDMGWDVFGNYPGTNGEKAKTPTIDSLAATGITFNNFWVNPECAPTRAAILTGKYGFRTGVGGVNASNPAVLQPTETIVQKFINDKTNSAYSNAVIGKWHVSQADQLNAPTSLGVEYFAGIMNGAIPDYYNWTENINGTNSNITTYSTTQLTNQAISWVSRQSKPFFLWLAYNAPHAPFHRPPLDLISDQTLSANQSSINADPLKYYLAAIEAMDKEISRFISSLTKAQKENTVFIIIGDNGTPNQVAQSPYIGKAKSTLYQGGINTPLIVSGKNITRKKVKEDALIQGPDMFCTLADLAQASSSNYNDGISFKPLFVNNSDIKRTYLYSELFGSSPLNNNDGYAIRNENYKLIHLNNGTEYFFNIKTDLFENNNLLLRNLSNEEQTNLSALRAIKAAL